MYLESKPSDTSREISKSVCYECQVIVSLARLSPVRLEYDVTTNAVGKARWQYIGV